MRPQIGRAACLAGLRHRGCGLLSAVYFRRESSLPPSITSLPVPSPLATLAATLLKPDVAGSLRHRGFVVIDDALDSVTCDALCRDIELLHKLGLLTPNESHHVVMRACGSHETTRVVKQGIWEVEGAVGLRAAPSGAAPVLRALGADSALLPALATALGSAGGAPSFLFTMQSLKAQLNEGRGGCFPLHVDSDAAVDARLATVLLYPGIAPTNGHVNESDSHKAPAGDSGSSRDGALRLAPFPFPPIDIPLRRGRAVVFSAQHMLHGTHPALSRRYCITLWLSGRRAAAEAPSGSSSSNAPPMLLPSPRPPIPEPAAAAMAALLRHPLLRLYVSRWAHAAEVAAAFPQAFGEGTEAAAAALDRHERETRIIAAALADWLERRGLASACAGGGGGGARLLDEVRALLPLPWEEGSGAGTGSSSLDADPLVQWW